MELYQLKSFVKIAETHNLRRAAGNLHISQSALSSQIKLLEEKLGLSPNRFVDAMDESVVKELVMDGQGVAILREDDARYVAGLSDVHIWKDVKFQVPLSVGILKTSRQDNMLDTITRLIRPLWS